MVRVQCNPCLILVWIVGTNAQMHCVHLKAIFHWEVCEESCFPDQESVSRQTFTNWKHLPTAQH